MAKEEKDEKKVEKQLNGKASVDWPQLVEATDQDPYHTEGQKFDVAAGKVAELVKRGWVKTIAGEGPRKSVPKNAIASAVVALLMLFSVGLFAQTSVLQDLKSVYSLSSDTVTNTGTVYLSTASRVNGAGLVTVQVNVTKISGTVGGTISLLGSLDGTNYKAINTQETQTALATVTATDASNVYHWRLSSSPFLYYRVSWTGTGTMAASFTAKLMKH